MHAGPVSMCCGLVSIHAHAAQVRYLYVPLGGAHRRALVVWPIFFFVAVWHDLEVRLLVGAQLVNGFMPTMPSALEQSGILHRSFTMCSHRHHATMRDTPLLQWRLMSWAWLICLAFVPEMAAKRFARSARFDPWRGTLGEFELPATTVAVVM